MRRMHLEEPQLRASEVDTPPAVSGRGVLHRAAGGPGWNRLLAGLTGRAGAVRLGVIAALALAVFFRFFTPSAMWLDEALTVNIARAPLGQIPHLLRHDGAPPLYYFLLHFWMSVFGEGNVAARSLAGFIGVLNLPLAWLAGYRLGSRSWAADLPSGERRLLEQRGRVTAWGVTLLLASSPFAIYYDTEARMYGLMILLTTLGVISVTGLTRRPGVMRAIGLAAVTSAMLYSHYWAIYLVLVAGVVASWCAWAGPYRLEARYGIAGLALGCLSFAPWVPTFLFQAAHTGTPWSAPAQLTALVSTVTQFAGGNSDAGRALALLFFFFGLLAVFGAPLDRWQVVLDLRSRPGVRLLVAVTLATLVVAIVAARLAGSAFADRYTAVIAFPALAVAAYGLTALGDRRVREGLLAVTVVLGFFAAGPNAYGSRTQAGQVGAAIAAEARPGAVVAYCPDQLGPGVSRVLGGRFREVTFPRGAPPEIVDWVDYLHVVGRARPVSFAGRLTEMAGSSGTVFYVWAPGYVGFGSKCQAIENALAAWQGHVEKVVVAAHPSTADFETYEDESLDRFSPR
jgi:mannosyltransferase